MAIAQAKALTSLENVKVYLGISSSNTADDQLLDLLINQACVMIQKELGTNIVKTTYTREVHDGDGENYIVLEHYPIIEISRVAVGRDTAMTVEYDATDASHATVQVTASEIKLKKIVQGVSTINSFALSDYATVDSLETAIDALSNWDAVVQTNFSGYPANELIPIAGYYANDSKASLEIADQNEVDIEIDSVKWSILYNPYGFDSGIRNVIVDYVAGYERENIPEPLASSCMELAGILYNMSKKDSSLKSEKLGQYGYTLADRVGAMFSSTGAQDVSNMVAMKIAQYKRILL